MGTSARYSTKTLAENLTFKKGGFPGRYDVNANLLFKWLRDPRFTATAVEDAAASFLPVEVVAAPAPPVIDPPVIEPKVSEAKIEISLSNGHHIRVTGAYDSDALCRLVRGLG